MMKRNDQWHTHRSCEYYAKAVVYLRLNPKYFFKLINSFDWCILENMNNEQRFKEKSLVLSHTETFN